MIGRVTHAVAVSAVLVVLLVVGILYSAFWFSDKLVTYNFGGGYWADEEKSAKNSVPAVVDGVCQKWGTVVLDETRSFIFTNATGAYLVLTLRALDGCAQLYSVSFDRNLYVRGITYELEEPITLTPGTHTIVLRIDTIDKSNDTLFFTMAGDKVPVPGISFDYYVPVGELGRIVHDIDTEEFGEILGNTAFATYQFMCGDSACYIYNPVYDKLMHEIVSAPEHNFSLNRYEIIGNDARYTADENDTVLEYKGYLEIIDDGTLRGHGYIIKNLDDALRLGRTFLEEFYAGKLVLYNPSTGEKINASSPEAGTVKLIIKYNGETNKPLYMVVNPERNIKGIVYRSVDEYYTIEYTANGYRITKRIVYNFTMFAVHVPAPSFTGQMFQLIRINDDYTAKYVPVLTFMPKNIIAEKIMPSMGDLVEKYAPQYLP